MPGAAGVGLQVSERLFLVQIGDTETGKIIEEPEKSGKMVITAFERIAEPCLRSESKDIIVWHEKQRECSRTY